MTTQTTYDLNAALDAARTASKGGNLAALKVAFWRIDQALTEGAPPPDEWLPKVPAFGVNPLVDQMLHDVFVTALEGGIGFWARSKTYRWSTDKGATSDLEGFYSDVFDADYTEGDPDAEFPPVRINRDVIAKGFARVAAGPVEGWHDTYRGKFLVMLQARLAGMDDNQVDIDYDAYDASGLVQIGMFGKVIFG